MPLAAAQEESLGRYGFRAWHGGADALQALPLLSEPTAEPTVASMLAVSLLLKLFWLRKAVKQWPGACCYHDHWPIWHCVLPLGLNQRHPSSLGPEDAQNALKGLPQLYLHRHLEALGMYGDLRSPFVSCTQRELGALENARLP